MKKKINFYKSLLAEIIETLCTICLIIDTMHTSRNPYGLRMRQHFDKLKEYSSTLRKEIKGEKHEQISKMYF